MEQLRRIGVFIDGTYFTIVNTYYRDHHEVQQQIDHANLLSFLVSQIEEQLNLPKNTTEVTRCHIYLGKPIDTNINIMLRQQEDLLKVGIDLQHFPVKRNGGQTRKEQGVDVALATDASLNISRIDIYVIIAGDGDFIPLVDKLRSMGKIVIVAYWHTNSGNRTTSTNIDLMRSATHAINLGQKIDIGLSNGNERVRKIFGLKPLQQSVKKPPLEIFEGIILSQTLNGGTIRKVPVGRKKRTIVFLKENAHGSPFTDFEPNRRVQFSIINKHNMKQAVDVRLIT